MSCALVRRKDTSEMIFSNNTNPFLNSDDETLSDIEMEMKSLNNTKGEESPYRRHSLQQQCHSSNSSSSPNNNKQTEMRRRPCWTSSSPSCYGDHEPHQNNQRFPSNVDSMSTSDLRRVVNRLVHERDDLIDELTSLNSENNGLRRQLYRNNVNQQLHSTSSNKRMINHLTRSSISHAGHSFNNLNLNIQEDVEDEDYNEEGDYFQDNMFLVPEDLKDDSPSKISVILSQSMTVLAQINNQDVIDKVCAGSNVVKQVVLGNVVGYCTSHVIRKFGKIAAGSIAGSFCLIKLAHHRGYISVDWKRIQRQMEAPGVTTMIDPAASDENTPEAHCNNTQKVDDDIAWLSKKLKRIRDWSKDNSYTVLGFWSGFVIHNFTS